MTLAEWWKDVAASVYGAADKSRYGTAAVAYCCLANFVEECIRTGSRPSGYVVTNVLQGFDVPPEVVQEIRGLPRSGQTNDEWLRLNRPDLFAEGGRYHGRQLDEDGYGGGGEMKR